MIYFFRYNMVGTYNFLQILGNKAQTIAVPQDAVVLTDLHCG